MPQHMHMWRDKFWDPGFVSHLVNSPLGSPDGHASVIVLGKVILNEPAYPIGHGQDQTLGFFAIRPAFAIDNRSALLPLDIGYCLFLK